jgi:hypothetical protein
MFKLVLLFTLLNITSAGQSVSTRMGARASALANAAFALTDPSALFHNVSALAFQHEPSAFFGYDRIPALPGADRQAAAINWPVHFGTLSAGVFRFGDEYYNEQLLSAAFSHRIDHTALGIKTNLVQYRADGFGTRSAFTLDIAGLTQLTSEWSIGAGIFNIGQAELSPDNPLPVIFVAGTAWKSSEGITVAVELEKKLGSPLQVKSGLEAIIHKKIFIRTGFGANPFLLSGGTGIRTTRIQFDFSVSYQPATSFQYQASAAYHLRKPRQS